MPKSQHEKRLEKNKRNEMNKFKNGHRYEDKHPKGRHLRHGKYGIEDWSEY